jgi:hypothetical protein
VPRDFRGESWIRFSESQLKIAAENLIKLADLSGERV